MPAGPRVNHQEDVDQKKGLGFTVRGQCSGPPEPGKLLRSPVTPLDHPQSLPQSQVPPRGPRSADSTRKEDGRCAGQAPPESRLPRPALSLRARAASAAAVSRTVGTARPPPRFLKLRDAAVTPQPPPPLSRGWVASGPAAWALKPASLQRRGRAPGARAPSARELGPGRRRPGCCCGPERQPRQAPARELLVRRRGWLTGRDAPLASSCSLPCRPSTGWPCTGLTGLLFFAASDAR